MEVYTNYISVFLKFLTNEEKKEPWPGGSVGWGIPHTKKLQV